MVQTNQGVTGSSSLSKWLLEQFTGQGLECSAKPLSVHPFNSEQKRGENINLQRLVLHAVPHVIDQQSTDGLVNVDGFMKDFMDLVKDYGSQVGGQTVDLYVATDGVFPGGHGYKNVQSPQRKVVSMSLEQALSFVFGTRGQLQKEPMFLLSPNEKHYIYQMDTRVLGDAFWQLQQTKSKLGNVENLQSQLIGSSQFYRNMWISSDQSLTPIHYDNSDNLFVQIFGKKHMILWEPKEKSLLYLNEEDHPTSDRQTRIDLTKEPSEIALNFPNFFKSNPVRVTLNPGDVMFIPKGWPHMVLSDGNSISLNYWWIGDDSDDSDSYTVGLFGRPSSLYCTEPVGEIKSLDDLPRTLETGGGFYGSKQTLYPVPPEFFKYYYLVCGQTRNYYSIKECGSCKSRYHTTNVCPSDDEFYIRQPKVRGVMRLPTTKQRNQKLVSSVSSVNNAAIGDRIFSSTCQWKDTIIVIGGPRATAGQMIQFIDVNTGNVSVPKLKNTSGKFVTETKWGHSATCVNDMVFIFGGFDSQYQYNDVICYDINAASLINVKTKGEVPSARAFHSATYIAKLNSILIFGGQVCKGGPYEYFNDMYLLNLSSFSWEKIKQEDHNDLPDPLSQHSAIHLPEKNSLLIIGGSDSTKSFSKVHCFDLKKKTWKIIYPDKSIPTLAFEAKNFRIHPTPQSACEINDSTVAILGFGDEGKGHVLLFDHNELSFKKANQTVGWVLGSFCTKPNIMHVINSNQQLITLKFDKIVLNSQCPNSDPHNWNYLNEE
ncbi:predicted protein [Naegleria gruberi]|uniref:Predicted protein n=1 Tax=Naegleria gruberi TaxID=5762 RepID=D2V3K7_NAEGR|nr:uncharacterized protein NAEGRDRAFT_78426 [Naegleria gruberi]EFC48787.1 predicted protein [Naegleria gruberi]|eukprot:XP_002681531.1 predicted protein [Naegleria gruberi strain NEG-M]